MSVREKHYKKYVPICELFEDDKKKFRNLPVKPFEACHYDWYKADGYGKVCVDGKHYYSTAPEYAKQELMVGFYAHTIEVLDADGKIIVTHPRQYGDIRTDTCDYSTSLAVLLKNVGAWHNSGVRADAPKQLKEYMDSLPKDKLKDYLRIMHDLTGKFGYEVAVQAMEKTCRNGNINVCDASVLADRILGYGLDTAPTAGPELEAYDALLLGGNTLC